MKKVEVFSKKLGKKLAAKPSQRVSAVMGWSNSAWQKDGWKKPVL